MGVRTWIAWGLALPWVAFAIVRTFGLDSGGAMAQVLAFTPYVAITTLVPLTIAAALRVWPAAGRPPRPPGPSDPSARGWIGWRGPLHAHADRTRDCHAPPGGFPLISAPLEIPSAPATEMLSVHTNPPTAPHWSEDLDALPGAESSPLRIMIGDFNATLDLAALRDVVDSGYADAAATVGDGFAATWQMGREHLPPLFAIDHVLADERIGIHEFSAHELPDTDHKAVFAELVLPRS